MCRVIFNGCVPPENYVLNALDCADGNPDLNPDTIWYIDNDSDGAGSASSTQAACIQPTGYVASSNDCDDNEPLRYPSASEVCDGLDNDCNGVSDDADGGLAAYIRLIASGRGGVHPPNYVMSVYESSKR